jgi:ABC-type bacteriocin/lantibiotic exporter with double-glycine peptidase domain
MVVLDEGTASLDQQTEDLIWDLIARMPITRIVVAHREALIHRASKVFRLEERHLTQDHGSLQARWETLARSKPGFVSI